MKPVLQLALDFLNLDRALKIAISSSSSVDWLEVGTPLIKSEGLDSVRKLHKKFPKKIILADMKIMDTGRLEVEAAAKAGANVVSVLAAAPDETILECVQAGRNFGVKIIADLIGVSDETIVKRALVAEKLGVDFIGVHCAIDEQMQGKNVLDRLRKVTKAVSIPVAAAGGLNSETVVDALKAGASIIVVGGAVTKSSDPGKAAREVKKAIQSRKRIKTKEFKRTTNVKSIFKKVSTANLSDAMHRSGDLKGINWISGKKMIGQATTVRTYPGDWAKSVEAIDVAGKNGVVVIDAGGMAPAVWGELATQSALQKKLAGVVVYGAIRDVEDIRKKKLTVYSKLISPTAGEPKGLGEINVNLEIMGVSVKPGDWIIGDRDGVVVVPQKKAVEIANRAMDVLERENRIRKEIKDGSTLSKVTNLLKWEKK